MILHPSRAGHQPEADRARIGIIVLASIVALLALLDLMVSAA